MDPCFLISATGAASHLFSRLPFLPLTQCVFLPLLHTMDYLLYCSVLGISCLMHDFVLFLILRGKARYISRGTASWKNRRATAKTPRR